MKTIRSTLLALSVAGLVSPLAQAAVSPADAAATCKAEAQARYASGDRQACLGTPRAWHSRGDWRRVGRRTPVTIPRTMCDSGSFVCMFRHSALATRLLRRR